MKKLVIVGLMLCSLLAQGQVYKKGCYLPWELKKSGQTEEIQRCFDALCNTPGHYTAVNVNGEAFAYSVAHVGTPEELDWTFINETEAVRYLPNFLISLADGQFGETQLTENAKSRWEGYIFQNSENLNSVSFPILEDKLKLKLEDVDVARFPAPAELDPADYNLESEEENVYAVFSVTKNHNFEPITTANYAGEKRMVCFNIRPLTKTFFQSYIESNMGATGSTLGAFEHLAEAMGRLGAYYGTRNPLPLFYDHDRLFAYIQENFFFAVPETENITGAGIPTHGCSGSPVFIETTDGEAQFLGCITACNATDVDMHYSKRFALIISHKALHNVTVEVEEY